MIAAGLPIRQQEIVSRLARNERLIGPVRVPVFHAGHRSAVERDWAWETGRAAHATTVRALIDRGVIEIRPAPDGKREAVLTSPEAKGERP